MNHKTHRSRKPCVIRTFTSACVIASVIVSWTAAWAQESPMGGAPTNDHTTASDQMSATSEPSGANGTAYAGDNAPAGTPFKHYSMTANPLALVVARASLNFEYLPVVHHGFMITPFVEARIPEISFCFFGNSCDEPDVIRPGSGGLELGYHFYSGHKGANGFFVGPSLIAAWVMSPGSHPQLGVAVDVGGQHVFDNGFTIGAGAGLMYTHGVGGAVSRPTSNSEDNQSYKQEFVFPRILFTLGYSM